MQSRRIGVWKRRVLRNLYLWRNQELFLCAPKGFNPLVDFILLEQSMIRSKICAGYIKNTISGDFKYLIKES